MPLEELRIDTETIRVDFLDHLMRPSNERIIFSAPFGTGKTTFLRTLASNDDLALVHLRPVNYTVAPNEDIFRLIKYDVVNELLVTHLLPFELQSIDRLVAYGVTLPGAAPKMMRSLLSAFGALNKDFPDPEKLVDLVDTLQQFVAQTEQHRQDSELNQRVIDYVDGTEKLLPLLENDLVTGFIQKGLTRLANQGRLHEPGGVPRTTVLIIDDLDRLDPEHTFRLFNVFSAHLDAPHSTTNKFGFDKVVFVCDIDNIRNLFHSRYGLETDFSGYIDKFYSDEIYHFDIGTLVASKVEEIVATIRDATAAGPWKREVFSEGGASRLGILLTEMASIRAITLRHLMGRAERGFRFQERKLGFDRITHEDYNTRILGALLLEVLTWIAGSVQALESALLKVRRWARSEQYRTKHYNERHLAEIFLVVAACPVHRFQTSEGPAPASSLGNETYPYRLTNGQEIRFRLTSYERGNPSFIASIVPVEDTTWNTQSVSVFDLMYDAFVVLKNSGYLR